MRSFRFPSTSKSRSLIDYADYRPLVAASSDPHDAIPLSTPRLIALTCGTGGLQLIWTLIMSNGTPYLITLGLPASLTALVWVTAPLSGVLIQPFLGVLSDRCSHPLGRRRPFIIAGAVGCVLCMLGLAVGKSAIRSLAVLLNYNAVSATTRGVVLTFAIANLLGLSVFIQPLQGGIRALIVDSCAAGQQDAASAWASRMAGVGNMIGFLFAFVPVREVLPFLEVSQFSWLCVVASVLLVGSVGTTCWVISEPDPRSRPEPRRQRGMSFVATLKQIAWSAKHMTPVVRQVCVVQFFAWLGWFPYLFYMSSYVGNLYAAPRLLQARSPTEQALIIEDAVRLGSLANLVFSIFALLTNILAPMLISPPSKTPSILSHPLRRITLTKAWCLSHVLYATSILLTILPQTQTTATLIAALIGIARAFTLWVPFSLIGREIAAQQESHGIMLGASELEMYSRGSDREDQVGVVLGLHNAAISAPQILAALVCSLIFWVCPRLGIEDAIGWVLRFGAVGGIVAAWITARMDV